MHVDCTLLKCEARSTPSLHGQETSYELEPLRQPSPGGLLLPDKHRYIFAVLALEAEKIEIDRGATPAYMMYMIFNGTLGRAFLEGWYEQYAIPPLLDSQGTRRQRRAVPPRRRSDS